jgi:hypothetical protein
MRPLNASGINAGAMYRHITMARSVFSPQLGLNATSRLSLHRPFHSLPCIPTATSRRQFHSTSLLQNNEKIQENQSSPSQNKPPAAKFSVLSLLRKSPQSASSFRKIVALAKPEKKPLTTAVGLLLISSAVSMSIPMTIGKLIDFFSSTNPVSTEHRTFLVE